MVGCPDVGVVALSYNVIPAGHSHTHVLAVRLVMVRDLLPNSHTSVMGIDGAFGKTNLTSSNLFLFLQFSASHILRNCQKKTRRLQYMENSTSPLLWTLFC